MNITKSRLRSPSQSSSNSKNSFFLIADQKWDLKTVTPIVKEFVSKNCDCKSTYRSVIVKTRDFKIDNKIRNQLMKIGIQVIQYTLSNGDSQTRINKILKEVDKILFLTNDLKQSENAGILNFETETTELTIMNSSKKHLKWETENWGSIPKFGETELESVDSKNRGSSSSLSAEYNLKLTETTKKIRKAYEESKSNKIGKRKEVAADDITGIGIGIGDGIRCSTTNGSRRIKSKSKSKKKKSYTNLLTIE